MIKIKTGKVGMGAIGIGAITVDMTLEDGDNWFYTGIIAGPTAGLSFSVPIEAGEFDTNALGHLAGTGWVGLAVLNLGAGICGLSFSDTQSYEGHINFAVVGLNIGGGGGVGQWTRGVRPS